MSFSDGLGAGLNEQFWASLAFCWEFVVEDEPSACTPTFSPLALYCPKKGSHMHEPGKPSPHVPTQFTLPHKQPSLNHP